MRKTTVKACYTSLRKDGFDRQFFLDQNGKQEVLLVLSKRKKFIVEVVEDEGVKQVHTTADGEVYWMPWECPKCHMDALKHDMQSDTFKCLDCGHRFG